jgi:hypothetical protein
MYLLGTENIYLLPQAQFEQRWIGLRDRVQKVVAYCFRYLANESSRMVLYPLTKQRSPNVNFIECDLAFIQPIPEFIQETKEYFSDIGFMFVNSFQM